MIRSFLYLGSLFYLPPNTQLSGIMKIINKNIFNSENCRFSTINMKIVQENDDVTESQVMSQTVL